MDEDLASEKSIYVVNKAQLRSTRAKVRDFGKRRHKLQIKEFHQLPQLAARTRQEKIPSAAEILCN
jgi:hypothetical protein